MYTWEGAGLELVGECDGVLRTEPAIELTNGFFRMALDQFEVCRACGCVGGFAEV